MAEGFVYLTAVIDWGTRKVLAHKVAITLEACQMRMDGRGAWRDHVMVERLWRSVKYEHVYLTAYAGVAQAKREIAHY